MRNLTWIFVCILCIMSSCGKEEKVTDERSGTSAVSEHRFYGVKNPESGISASGVAQINNLWYNCSVISVRFLNGSKENQQKVKNYAAEWEKYSGVRFRFVEEGNTDVRIGFDWNGNRNITWSYTGNKCFGERNQNEATMSFASWQNISEQEKKGDVLRAFGQVLGLELEHRHPKADPKWSSNIAEYWKGKIVDINWDILKGYVFDPLQSQSMIATKDYDPASIMIWPFPQEYAGNAAREFNYVLSVNDISYIQQIYPKNVCEKSVVVTMKTEQQTIQPFDGYNGIQIEVTGEVEFDWGDGTRQIIPANSKKNMAHQYANPGEHVIKIYGDTNALTGLSCSRTGLNYLDVSQNEKLTRLQSTYNQISALDVSKNKALQHLDCSNNQIKVLELSQNTKLTLLSCRVNQIELLDVSKMPDLLRFNGGFNRFSNLDISKNTKLQYFNCEATKTNVLDMSQNKNLESIIMCSNSVDKLDLSNNINLKQLHCRYNAFTKDQSKMVNVLATLSNRVGKAAGSIMVINNEHWIEEICTAKNWTVVTP